MKLKEIRERLRDTGQLTVIKLPEVPKATFKLLGGARVDVIGDINTPGQMYVCVYEDIRKYTTEKHQIWLGEVIHAASRALGYAVPPMSATCSTHLDLAPSKPDDWERIEGKLQIRGGPILYTQIDATSQHASFTIQPLERYASALARSVKKCGCGNVAIQGSTFVLEGYGGPYVAKSGIEYTHADDVPLCQDCCRELEKAGLQSAPF